MADPLKLTKADTAALWHAVQWMALCIRHTPDLEQMTGEVAPPEALTEERKRLTAARRALRKVNAIRKAAASSSEGKGVGNG